MALVQHNVAEVQRLRDAMDHDECFQLRATLLSAEGKALLGSVSATSQPCLGAAGSIPGESQCHS
jgi:hypothetical protein